MRMVILVGCLLVTPQLVGCNPSSEERQPGKNDDQHLARPANADLLSADGELFPLSTYFGVCLRRAAVLRATFSNGMLSPHYTTSAEIVGDGGLLKFGVGKIGMYPGTTLKEVPATALPRRIQLGRDRFGSFVLVSDFEAAGNNSVTISYDEKDPEAQSAAIRVANNVVACHVSMASPGLAADNGKP